MDQYKYQYQFSNEIPEILESHEIPDENDQESGDEYIKRKRREFLDETIEHFSHNPRAVNSNGSCSYSHNLNGGCAIGRKLSPEKAELMAEDYIQCSGNYEKLPMNLYLLGVCFLMLVQELHDNSYYWGEGFYIKGEVGKLSDSGKEKVEQIKNLYILN